MDVVGWGRRRLAEVAHTAGGVLRVRGRWVGQWAVATMVDTMVSTSSALPAVTAMRA